MAPISDTQGSRHAAILGIGAYRPSRIVPNADVVEAIESSDEWIQQRSGIKTAPLGGARRDHPDDERRRVPRGARQGRHRRRSRSTA